MVTCHAKYPELFGNSRVKLFDAVCSAEARYRRLATYHPGIVRTSRWTRDRITGYPADYPYRIFRVENICNMLQYHFEIVDFEHACMREIISIRKMTNDLSRIIWLVFQNFSKKIILS